MTNIRIKTDNKDFVARYHAAQTAKFTRQEFAHYHGVEVDTISRRRLRIIERVGLYLAYLPFQDAFDGAIDTEKVEIFERAYKQIIQNDAGPPPAKVSRSKKQVFVITCAQNATPLHKNFNKTCLKYCEIRNARYMIIPIRYRNPTSIWSAANRADEYWFTDLHPYLVTSDVQLCKGLRLIAEAKIQPTANAPLSGYDGLTGSDSAIFGHPKVQLKTVATPNKNMPKILTTSGACTEDNYTDSKAGHKGKFHHNISAIIVEVDDDKFHIRQVHGDEDGSFYDLEYLYTTTGRKTYGGIAGFVPGDIHAEFIDASVEGATFIGAQSIVGALNPEVMVLHDVEDFYRRNHHHKNNDIIAFGKHHFDRDNVEDGLQITADFITRITRPGMTNLIVPSNHDEAFDRWLNDCDPKLDPENSRLFHYMKLHQLSNVKKTPTGFITIPAFELWCNNPLDREGLPKNENTRFLKRDESYMIAGIEIGFHGDVGINGARGAISSFAKIGPKTVIGHSHSPGITEGAYQVGVSARRDLEYAVGPSSWLHTHCIIYPNGSRALINVINGEWRASYYGNEASLIR